MNYVAPLIGLVVFVIGIFISRVIMTRALQQLTDEQKLVLLNSFTGRSLMKTAVLIVILIAFVATFYFSSEFGVFETIIFLLLFLLYVSYTSITTYQELVRLSLPRGYIKKYLTSACFVLVGLIGMAAITVYSMFIK